MSSSPPPHRLAALQALLVTFLWSTSWVLIKIGLKDMPALTFAGLRYSLAFVCLLPFALRPNGRAALRRLKPRQWLLLIVLGLTFYTIVQGAQFLGLAYLPAASVSLTLNFTAVVVAIMGVMWLNEPPGRWGWGGIMLSVVGGLVFFHPVQLPGQQGFGLLVSVVGMLTNAFASVFGRRINSREGISPLIVTTVSMGVGGLALLLLGAAVQEIPRLDARGLAIILWLAVVNTAFAFTLWNHTLRTLSAMESTLINGTMLIQIALLAWLFLGETLTTKEIGGMLLVAAGVAVVQLKK
jgi:drug/metabolite transporter (DMT)-like permease